MTLSDIAEFACETTGDISSEALDFAKRAIRLKYDTLYIAHNWREAMRVINLTLDPALAGVLFLPYDAEEVIFLSLSYDGQNYVRLVYRERDWIERFATPTFSVPGNTPWFFRAENLAWPYLSPGHMTFTSSSLSSFRVHIEGRDQNDFPVVEDFDLQGIRNPDNSITPGSVSSVNSYKYISVLSKDVSDMPLLIADGLAHSISLPGGMTELVFTQIVLSPPPLFTSPSGTPASLYVRTQVKLKSDSLNSDYSVPRISSMWDALVCFTTSALYRRMQQVAKAQASEQEGIQHIQAAVNKEKNQAEWRQQAVPVVYESGTYLDSYGRGADSFNPFG